MRMVRSAVVVGTAFVLIAASGCGGSGRDPEYERQLRAFAIAYDTYSDSTRVSPSGLDDIRRDWGSFPLVRADIESGQFIVTWNAAMESSAAENDRYVLGYEVDAPANGGLVLLGGGTVRQVTAEEFAQLKRFKPQGQKK